MMNTNIKNEGLTLNMLPGLEIKDSRKAVLSLDFHKPFTGQVEEYLRSLGDIREVKKVGLVGQAVAASLMLPALEMISGLPEIALQGFGAQAGLLGWLDLAEYRHNQVRPHRTDLATGEAFPGYTVLDGAGRGLTPDQLTELAKKLNVEETLIRVLDINMGQADMAKPHVGMIEKVIASGVTFSDLTSGRVLHLPAGSGIVAAVMATTIYGLGETWPKTIRLNRQTDGTFRVDEIVDPQSMRNFGTKLCAEIIAAIPAVIISGNLPEEFRQGLAELAEKFGIEVRG